MELKSSTDEKRKKKLQISQGRKAIFKRAIVRLVVDFKTSTLNEREGNAISYWLVGVGEKWGTCLGRIL